jgi:WD40 repeat protein
VWEIGDVRTLGRQLVILRGHLDGVTSAAFDKNGKQVLTSSQDGTARLWQLDIGTPIEEQGFRASREPRTTSRDGRLVLIPRRDLNYADVEDSSTKEIVVRLSGHSGSVSSAQFNETDTLVVTASYDGSARVWDVATGQTIATFVSRGEALENAFFDTDKRSIITASRQGRSKRFVCNACGSVEDLMMFARERAEKRTLTPEERKRFLHEDSSGIWDSLASFFQR